MPTKKNRKRMQQIRNAYTNICMVLLISTACSRAVQYGMHATKQTEPEAVLKSMFINAIPKKPNWFGFLEKAGEKLEEYFKQQTLPYAYNLHYAAYKGDVIQLAKWIETHSKWINKTMDDNVTTPLHLAVFRRNLECVQLLLDAGANVRTLMDEKNAYIQPIHIAAQGNALAVLRGLVCVQPTVVADCDATGKTALHWAASQGHTCCVQELLQAGSNANSEDHQGHTPLCFALEGNHSGAIEQLLNAGSRIECITCMHNDSDRLLRWALAHKAYKCIAAVVRKGNVSVDLYRKDAAGQTLFDCALQIDHPPSIRNLLGMESGGNWVNHTDQAGTPLLHHAILGNHPSLLAELLASSTLTVNAQDAAGKTALQLAAEQGLLSLVQQLLAVRGIDVNQKDNEGQTALYAALTHEHMEVAKVLMQLSAVEVTKKSPYNQTLLEVAFEENYMSFFEKLCDSGEDIHVKDSSDKTLLHRAAETERLEIMEALSKVTGIDANAEDIDGNTPLHLAASNGHAAAVEALLKVTGIKANAKNIDGNTPLHLAASNGHAAAVEALSKVTGIDAYAKNNDGKTPLNLSDANGHASWADVNGHPSVAAILLRAKNQNLGKRKWEY